MKDSFGFESEVGNAEKAENMITAAESFGALETALDELGRIKGSDGSVYSADEIVETIHNVRNGEPAQLVTITSREGLREKVAELYVTEQLLQAETVDDVIKLMNDMRAASYSLKASTGDAYEHRDLIQLIQGVHNEEFPEELLTSRYGLRDVVIRLRDQQIEA